jgi:hypothetical protein
VPLADLSSQGFASDAGKCIHVRHVEVRNDMFEHLERKEGETDGHVDVVASSEDGWILDAK